MYFDGSGLVEEVLRQALAKHTKCWTGFSREPSVAAVDIRRLAAMVSETTAVDRSNALSNRLKEYFKRTTAERISRESQRRRQKVTYAVITKSLVSNLRTHQFNVKVYSKLQIQGGWEDKPPFRI